jgi:hypothetical protein
MNLEIRSKAAQFDFWEHIIQYNNDILSGITVNEWKNPDRKNRHYSFYFAKNRQVIIFGLSF